MTKKILYILIVVFFVGLFLISFKIFKSDRLEEVEDFRIYYRDINDEILNDMGNYDLVIVEGLHFNKQDVEKVKRKKDTLILGYLSIMEIGNWDDEIIKGLYPSDYLYIDEARVKNNKNYLGNISSEHYQDILIESLEKRALSKGMDGVFLDTVGTLDDYKRNDIIYNTLLSGYEQFLQKLRRNYPGIYIIQNRGFEALTRVSSDYIDGVLWENFNASSVDKRESVKERIDTLKILEENKKLIVFTESYENGEENNNFTEKMGWIHFQNNSNQHSNWFQMKDNNTN